MQNRKKVNDAHHHSCLTFLSKYFKLKMELKYYYNPALIMVLFISPPGNSAEIEPPIIIDEPVILEGYAGTNNNYQVVGGGRLSGYGISTKHITVGNGTGWSGLILNSGYDYTSDEYENLIEGNLTINDKGQVYVSTARISGNVVISGKDSRGVFARSTITGQLIASDANDIRMSFVTSGKVNLRDSLINIADSVIRSSDIALEMVGSKSVISRTSLTSETGVIFSAGQGLTASEVEFTTSTVTANKAFIFDNGGRELSDPHKVHAKYYSRFTATDLITARNGASAEFSLDDHSSASGNVTADADSSINIVLENNSTLTGMLNNVNRLGLDSSSQFNVTGDSSISSLSLGGGAVHFARPSGGGFRTLSLGTLEGGGSFYMNTDAAGMQGDFIDVAGSASGSYLLHVANTGAEPAQTEDALRLVRTGGGNAGFTLNGGRVDIGAWQYFLVQSGNEWELVQTGSGPGPGPGPGPDPDPEPEPNPEPEPGPDPEPGPGTDPKPGPSTSASTDAVLSMASAPRFMFYGELSGLSNRAQSLRGGHQSGVWGTYLHNGDRVKGAWQSAYRLEQDGLMLGADTARDNAYGSLVTGAFVSSSSGRVKHARGGKSRIDAWGGGLYATQRSDTGWYADAVLKLNRFENSLSARMTDGADVSGSWNTWGYGASLEAGRELQYSGGLSLTPYVSLTGYQNQSKRVELSNGMTARTGSGRSVRAEAGARAAATLSAGGVPVRPYLRAALTQELAKGGTVRINYRYDFADDFAGSGARAGAGVSVSVTPAATLWLDAGWARGERHESPVSGSAGLRFTF